MEAERHEEQRSARRRHQAQVKRGERAKRTKPTKLGPCAWSITRANGADLAWVPLVSPEIFDAPLDEHHLSRFLEQTNHGLFLAQLRTAPWHVVGQVRGQINFQPDGPPQLYLDNLGVDPKFQRLGIGTALVQALKCWAFTEFGAGLCWLGTEPDNRAAQALYRSMGFQADAMTVFELS